MVLYQDRRLLYRAWLGQLGRLGRLEQAQQSVILALLALVEAPPRQKAPEWVVSQAKEVKRRDESQEAKRAQRLPLCLQA